MSFLIELKRRNVLRVGAAYVVVSWLVIQVAETILPVFGFSDAAVRFVIIGLGIGFLPVLVAAWAFELTPEGLKWERLVDRNQSITPQTGKRLDRFVMVALALAVGYFAFDKFLLAPRRETNALEQLARDSGAFPEDGQSTSSTTLDRQTSIVVLPFVDMSQAKDQEYFSDGISEELLNLLARVQGLRVISRTSAFSFKTKHVELSEIARRLKVTHVLEGSVRKDGNRIRITAQLIDARLDSHLWSRTWDRQLEDIFAIQDEIAAEVVNELQLALMDPAPRTSPIDPGAYAMYLQARQLSRQGTRQGYEQAIDLYQRVLQRAPNYAPAWDGLSASYSNQTHSGLRPLDEGFRLAREAAERALLIDPGYAPAHASLGWISMTHDRELAAAARHYERALALDPTNLAVLGDAGALAQSLGRLDQAIRAAEYVVGRDPVDGIGHYNLGHRYLAADRPDDAIASFRTALQLTPDRVAGHYSLGMALVLKGDFQAALSEFEKEPDESWRLIGLPIVYHALGRARDSDAALAQLISKYHADSAFNIAYVLAYRGERDRAFEWLAKAREQNDSGLSEILIQPLFNSLHSDPRWAQFLRTIGQDPAQLESIPFKINFQQ